MIISRTPYRVSLFGGGTDYPAWYRQHGGIVIGTTINKYCYISIRHLPPFFEHRHRIVYSKIELPNEISAIEHPAVRAVLQERGVNVGVEIQHHGDLPARSGVGSSCSFTVGLLNAVRAFEGQMSSPEWLAREAIRIEQEVIREKVGSQDQIWAAYGGTNLIRFSPDNYFRVSPIIMSHERRSELQSHLMLFFTRSTRIAATVASEQIANLSLHEQQLNQIQSIAYEAAAILTDPQRSVRAIGPLLHESWLLKKELAQSVSTPLVDELYDAARSAGALGGKLLGAGGGGFMLLFADPANQPRIRERLRSLIEVSFGIGSPGSKIVMYEPDTSDERHLADVAEAVVR
jgi:D-glycero-alpha-D-manno-heptose-7-phosphate kinase